jgi:RNA polymerase sigma factor (sigma-70 family)
MRLAKREHTEQEIIQGCIANDRRYQEILYRNFFDTMERMVRRYTTDEEKVLEILNNGFLKVFKKIDSFRGEGSFEGWIRRIVYHSISDFFKRESGYLRFIVLEEAEQDEPHNALEGLYYQDLMQIIESLPDRSRQVFSMYAVEGYAHKEIAERLGISEGTSKWHLSNAREQLKKILETRLQQRHYAG